VTPPYLMVAADAHGKRMKIIANHCKRHLTPRWKGLGLSRSRLVPAHLGLGFTEPMAVASSLSD